MNWINRWLERREAKRYRKTYGAESYTPEDIERIKNSPVRRLARTDDPLNHNGDGTIKAGDASFQMFMDMVKDGKARHMVKRPDGTWDVEIL